MAHQPDPIRSPLDEIQATEAEVNRRIEIAREAATRLIADAQKQASELQQAAQDAGRRAGQIQFAEVIQQANEAASALLAEAQKSAQEIHHKGEREIDDLAAFAVRFVLGTGPREE